MPIQPFFVVIVIIVCLIIGLSKGGLGAALVVLCIPLLSLVMPVQQAISMTLPLLIFADLFALAAFWQRWDLHHIKLLLPPAIVGILLGTYLLANLDDVALRRLVGLFVLLFVIYKIVVEPRLLNVVYQPRDWHGMLTGVVSGFGSALANVGGPPFTIYMLFQQELTPIAFAGTATLFFAIVNVLKLPGLIAAQVFDLHDLTSVLWALPVIPISVYIGRRVVNHLNRKRFDQMMLALLTFNAIFLLTVPPSS
ncbi:MAG: sulfite exporter TauE/SafE family protein [Anaerolineae bacterium]|nr:sulfite exporter TauE/SafE family protein [Anaerolineae bacterium]